MTESVTTGIWPALRPIQDELAGLLGCEAREVLGVPLAIAFLVRNRDHGRFFLSGLSHDFATLAIESLGAQMVVDPLPIRAGGAMAAETAVLTIVDEVWSPTDDGPAVGFGPVALAAAADPSLFTNCRRLTVVAGNIPERTRLERAEQLRTTFLRVATRLAKEIAPAVDWSILGRTNGPAQVSMGEALKYIAATRSAVGSYLIEQADELDDERIDQLGDGYVRSAELWRSLAHGDWAHGPELHELERSCVAWMRNAAARPTRYAF